MHSVTRCRRYIYLVIESSFILDNCALIKIDVVLNQAKTEHERLQRQADTLSGWNEEIEFMLEKISATLAQKQE